MMTVRIAGSSCSCRVTRRGGLDFLCLHIVCKVIYSVITAGWVYLQFHCILDFHNDGVWKWFQGVSLNKTVVRIYITRSVLCKHKW